MTIGRVLRVGLASFAVAAAGLGIVGAARADAAVDQSASAEARQEVGQVTLFEGATFTDPVTHLSYTSCSSRAQVTGQVRSFDNRPMAGCQVVLARASATFELCVGRGQVPAAFQNDPLVRIEPGSSVPCSIAA
jgi:hypothetical protein